MLFSKRNSIQYRILGATVGGGLLVITVFLAFWISNGFEMRSNMIKDSLRQENNEITSNLHAIVHDQYNTAKLLSHSLALRRYAIELGQSKINKPPDQVRKEIGEIDRKWSEFKVTSDIVQEILFSLEARYLKDTVAIFSDIIDKIEVTDAFGTVRIASKMPERFLVFNESWWQNALMMNPGNVFNDEIESEEGQLFWDISLPLRNDDGVDAVGIIRIRFNLTHIFDKVIYGKTFLDSSTHIITPFGIYPPMRSPFFLSPSELNEIRIMRNGVLNQANQDLLIAFSNVFTFTDPGVPHLDWFVVTLQKFPTNLSFKFPAIRNAFLIWLAGVFTLILVSLIISRWIIDPLVILTRAVKEIGKGHLQVRLPTIGHGEIATLSLAFNTMAKQLAISREKVQSLLDRMTDASRIITDFVQETSEITDNQQLAEKLLNFSIKHIKADAGLVMLPLGDAEDKVASAFKIPRDLQSIVSPVCQNVHWKKALYYSWSHPQLNGIWKRGFQIMISVPIRTKDILLGHVCVFFIQAPDRDLESDSVLDLLALQAGIRMDHNNLNSEMIREKNKMEGILAGISALICIIDRNMNITWHNQYSYNFLDEDCSIGLTGTRCYTTLRTRKKICPDCPVHRTFQTGESQRIIQRWLTNDQQIRWVEAMSFPLKDHSGSINSVILMNTDVTQKIEEDLAVQRFSHTIENIVEAVIILNLEAKIVYINSSFKNLCNFDFSEVENESVRQLFPSENLEILDELLNTVRKGEKWRGELVLLTKNGNRIFVSLSATRILDSSGFPTGFVFTCYDITNERRQQLEMMKRYRELDILNQISQIMTRNFDAQSILRGVFKTIMDFSGANSGFILNVDSRIQKPEIIIEQDVPAFLIKHIEEIRLGRDSNAFFKALHHPQPQIYEDLRVKTDPESKLLIRLGFHSAVLLRLENSEGPMYILGFLSHQAIQFRPEDFDIYKSVSALVSVSVQNCQLQEKLLKEAGLVAVGEVVSQIGGDVKQVLQGLEASRHLINTALEDFDKPQLEQGWLMVSRQIWQLFHVTLNILDYSKDFPQFFFPEDLNQIIEQCVENIHNQKFSQRLKITFHPDTALREVYVNKLTLIKAITNLLAISIDAVWQKDDPTIEVNTEEIVDKIDFYRISIRHNGSLFPIVDNSDNFEPTLLYPGVRGAGLAMSIVHKVTKSHNGNLRILRLDKSDISNEFILELPRYPVKKI